MLEELEIRLRKKNTDLLQTKISLSLKLYDIPKESEDYLVIEKELDEVIEKSSVYEKLINDFDLFKSFYALIQNDQPLISDSVADELSAMRKKYNRQPHSNVVKIQQIFCDQHNRYCNVHFQEENLNIEPVMKIGRKKYRNY